MDRQLDRRTGQPRTGRASTSTSTSTSTSAGAGTNPARTSAERRGARRVGLGTAAALGAILVLPGALAPAAAFAEDEGSVDISVTIPETTTGEFVWSATPAVSLGDAVVEGTHLQATSSALQVTVTDTRIGLPGWVIDGVASQFETDDAGEAFSSAYLGWRPVVEPPGGSGAVAGPEVASGYDPSNPLVPIDDATHGLANEESRKVLARAETGHGGDAPGSSGTITAHLTLQVPITTPAGEYESMLMLRATLGG